MSEVKTAEYVDILIFPKIFSTSPVFRNKKRPRVDWDDFCTCCEIIKQHGGKKVDLSKVLW